MPRPRCSRQYPSDWGRVLEAAILGGKPIEIPCPPGIAPNALRTRFYGFFAALRREADPLAELSWKAIIRTGEGSITISSREDDVWASTTKGLQLPETPTRLDDGAKKSLEKLQKLLGD